MNLNGITEIKGRVVDDEYKKDGDGFLSLSEYISDWGNRSVLILGIHNYNLMLKKYEYLKTKVSHIYDLRVNCVNGELVLWNKEDAKNNLASFKEVYDMLADEKSRRVMELYLRAAVNGEFDALYKECYEPTAYFNSITKDMPVDVMIDCGAFDGDSIGDFTKVFPNYKRIIALEPDEQNAIKLRDNMEKNRIDNVEIIKKGVYSKTGVLKFCILGNEASFMSEDGNIEVPVVALDDILKNYDKSKVFIKMDVEGSEPEALQGAANFIAKNHPILAVCVYHKEEHLFTVPKYIESIVPKGTYEYYLGFHGNSLSELVFYAIPN